MKGGVRMEGGMLEVVGWYSWWSVRWSVMERESGVTTRISHPLFQQVAPTVMCGMWTGSGRGTAARTDQMLSEPVWKENNKWTRI